MGRNREWDLIVRCRRGSTAAFEPLVTRYEGEALAIANALLLDRDEAADAVQDAFVRAYRSLSRLAEGSAFGPWFRSIVRNRCLDRLRSANHRQRAGWNDQAVDAVAWSEADAGRVEREELSALVQDALATLTREHREVIALKELEGLRYDEIAAALGISAGTVASRLFHARAALKKALAARGITGSAA